MALPIVKLAPTAVVACMVTYCCWAHLVSGPVVKIEPGKLPTIATTLLSPVIAEAVERDPFQATAIVPKLATQEHEPKTVTEPAKSRHDTDDVAPIDTDHWVLNATLLRGERRFAVINGKLYAIGESLPGPDSADSAYVIDGIDADQVVIRGPNDTVDLRYNDVGALGTRGTSQPKAVTTTQGAPRTPTKRASSNSPAPKASPKQPDKAKH